MKEAVRRLLRLVDNRWVVLLPRLALGVLFIISSTAKLGYPDRLVQSVRSYEMLPDVLAQPFATGLPFIELFIGFSLVLGVLVFIASAVAIPFTLSLAIANIYALVRGVGGESCDCLGSLVSMGHGTALAVDFAMALAAVVLLARHRKAESLGLGRLLPAGRLGLNRIRIFSLQLFIVLLGVVLAASVVRVHWQSPVREAIIQNEGAIGLIYRYSEESAATEADMEVLLAARSDFADVAYLRIAASSEDAWAARVFPVQENSVLFFVAGQDGGQPQIRHRIESPLDASSIEAAILGIADRASSP